VQLANDASDVDDKFLLAHGKDVLLDCVFLLKVDRSSSLTQASFVL
jgi:hypothetical protein